MNVDTFLYFEYTLPATGEDLTAVIVTTVMVGKFAIVIAYAIVCLYATEIFPTVVR